MVSVAAMLDGPLPPMVPLVLNVHPDFSLPLLVTAKYVQLDALLVQISLQSARSARVGSRRTPMITLFVTLSRPLPAVELFVLMAVSDLAALPPALPAHRAVRPVMDRLLTIVSFALAGVMPSTVVASLLIQMVSVLEPVSSQITTRKNVMVSFLHQPVS